MILDTNALSAFADNDPAIVPHVQRADALYIPVVVLGEYRYGVARSKQRPRHETWLGRGRAYWNVLPLLEESAVHYARIRFELSRSGGPIPTNDIWIAALAREHDLPVLSRDRHFDAISGVIRIDW